MISGSSDFVSADFGDDDISAAITCDNVMDKYILSESKPILVMGITFSIGQESNATVSKCVYPVGLIKG